MATTELAVGVVFVFFGSVTCTALPPTHLNPESILINLTAGIVSDTHPHDSNNLQVKLNISVGEDKVLVNDIPVELSAVTRLNCQALPLECVNGSSVFECGDQVSVVTRVMVSQNRLYNNSEEVVALRVFTEVIEIEGKEVQQADMCEVKILMSPDFKKLAQFTNIYPIGHSEIFRVSRDNDIVVTNPPNPRKDEEQLISQTAGQEEFAAPGKLPETPLRMGPDLYNDEFDDRKRGHTDQLETEASMKELISSYSAVCQWVERAKQRLRRFGSESVPLFFQIMWVVVTGIAGSAVIIRILDILYPTSEQKHIFLLNPVTLMLEEETHTLLNNISIEAEEEKKP